MGYNPCIPLPRAMKYLRIGLLVAAVCLPAPVSAGELVLSFKDGRVTLKATDVTLRQVLNEWARLGQTRIVGLEKLGGGLLTLELTDVPEKQALEILLAQRRRVRRRAARERGRCASMAANSSRFDRLMLLPTSIASAAPMGPAQTHGVCAATACAISGSDSTGQRGARRQRWPESTWRAGLQSQWRAGEAPALPADPGRADARPASRAGPDDPNAPAPANGPAPAGTPPLVTTRPGVIPVPQTPPRP